MDQHRSTTFPRNTRHLGALEMRGWQRPLPSLSLLTRALPGAFRAFSLSLLSRFRLQNQLEELLPQLPIVRRQLLPHFDSAPQKEHRDTSTEHPGPGHKGVVSAIIVRLKPCKITIIITIIIIIIIIYNKLNMSRFSSNIEKQL